MVDIAQIKRQVDLMAIVARDTNLKYVARTGGGEYAGPCPFCGGRDRFRLQPFNPDNGPRWLCRECGGGQWHDAIDYICRREDVSLPEACSILTNGQLPQKSVSSSSKPAAPSLPEIGADPPPAAWQDAAMTAAIEAANELQRGLAWLEKFPNLTDWPQDAPTSARVAAWLQSERGLTPETIRRRFLGYNPQWVEVMPGCKLAPGVVIPSVDNAALWYVQVKLTRQAAAQTGNKYLALKGSVLNALYYSPALVDAQNAILVEGELDTMLLEQEAGDLAAVATMGSATSAPAARWRVKFSHVRRLFFFLDQDQAGQKGLQKLQELVPFGEAMPPGPAAGQDITDFWKSGGDLTAWITTALNS